MSNTRKVMLYWFVVLVTTTVAVTACGLSPEEMEATAAVQTAEAASPTPTIKNTPRPSDTPTPTPLPTSTPTPLPTSTPPDIVQQVIIGEPPMATSCASGPANFYTPLTFTEDAGEIDGREFYFDA